MGQNAVEQRAGRCAYTDILSPCLNGSFWILGAAECTAGPSNRIKRMIFIYVSITCCLPLCAKYRMGPSRKLLLILMTPPCRGVWIPVSERKRKEKGKSRYLNSRKAFQTLLYMGCLFTAETAVAGSMARIPKAVLCVLGQDAQPC